MRKFALLLAMGLLAACGGGGGGDSASLDTSVAKPVTIEIVRPAAKALAKADTATEQYMRRVVITNPTNPYLGGWTLVYPDYQESAAPAPINLWVADNYKIEVLDYTKTIATGVMTPTYYGTTTFNVTISGGSATVTTPAVQFPTLTLPGTIAGKIDGTGTFPVTAVYPVTNNIWETAAWSVLGGYTLNSVLAIMNATSAAATPAAPSPVVGANTYTAYFVGGKFILKNSLKKPGDKMDFTRTPVTQVLTSNTVSVTPPPPAL